MKRMTLVEALREAIREEMERDPDVFCIGEDIGIPGGFGGAFTVTLGLEEDFRERVLDTPISEAGFFGVAVGAAVMGMRPIADLQYADFIFCAMDQIVNQAVKMRYMSGGKIKVPMVMRAPVGATTRGAQHAQNPEPFFMGVPGLKVVAPATAYDAKGLLKAAVRDDNPVLMFEHKLLYGTKGARAEVGGFDSSGDIPEEDYTVPIGEGVVRREGSDVTIVAALMMMHLSLAAAEQLSAKGISAEVIDPRTLVPLDEDLITESVKKTGRLVIVEESPKTGGVGAEIAAVVAETVPDFLLAPIRRIAAPDTPVPFAPIMENFYKPSVESIVSGVEEAVCS